MNRRTVLVITPPAMPVTAAKMQEYLALDSGLDAALLEAFIEASFDAIRSYCRRSITTETLELRMDGFPRQNDDGLLRLGAGLHVGSYPFLTYGSNGGAIDLPYGPVASVVSVTTFGKDNSSNVYASANYRADQSRVYLNEGASWPTDLRRVDGVAIRYVSGDAVAPPAIVQAIKQHVTAMYECREGCELPDASKAILAPYRRYDTLGFE